MYKIVKLKKEYLLFACASNGEATWTIRYDDLPHLFNNYDIDLLIKKYHIKFCEPYKGFYIYWSNKEEAKKFIEEVVVPNEVARKLTNI